MLKITVAFLKKVDQTLQPTGAFVHLRGQGRAEVQPQVGCIRPGKCEVTLMLPPETLQSLRKHSDFSTNKKTDHDAIYY